MKKGLMRVGAFATALVMTASALSVSVYAAPAYYNSRDYGYVTSVKDQGNWGTCWAFAGTSVSETSLIKKYPERFTAGTLDLSENIYTYMIAHPALFGPLNLSGDTATYTGSSSTHYLEIGGNAWCAAFAIMNGVGPYYESAAYPYDAFGTPGIADKNFTEAEYNELRDSGMAKMTGFYLARMGDGSGNEELKQLILDYGSAVITYCETYTDGQFGTNGGYYYYCPTAYTINHAVTVVGWDDNIPASAFKTAPEGNGAWLVKNSWGESQRDGGYFWISYYDKTIGDKCVTYDYTIEGEDDYYDKRYSYDSGNNFTYFYNNSFEELYWGDIFTAEEDSYINGASFYINKGVTVEASVYTDLKDANDPSSGTKAATATIVPQYEGYNAVTFDNPPKVTNGSKFSIVLKLNDSVKSPRIYTENAISMTDVTYSLQSKAGESFYAIDPADGWHDMYSEGFKNLLLKAYATVNKRACQHTYGNWITDKAPTCTAEGTKHRVCSKCGESETGTIAATGHKYVDTVVKPSYTAKGYTLHKCSVCGDSYKDNYTDMLVISGVSSLTAKEVTYSSVTLGWNTVSTVSGYIIEQNSGGKWSQITKIPNNKASSYTVNNLSEGTTYPFRIKAYVTDSGKEYYSSYTNLNVNTLMKTPANIKGSATSDSVTIQWDKNANATGYIVEQYKSGAWTKLGVISSNATVKYTVKGLAEGTTYSFRVKSYKNADSKTDYSTYANINVRTLMKTPANIKGSATADSVTIQWDKNANATGYIVEQYKSGSWTKLGVISNNATVKYTVKGLAEGTTYSFRVKSYKNADGKTDYSAYANINVRTLMKTPANIKGSSTADSVTIQWDKNANATGYIVEQYKSGAWTKLGVISNNATVKYTVKGLAEGTTYSFRVKSYKNADSKTDYSTYANINVRTLMKTPANIKGSSTADSVTIQWDKNANATGYIVEQYKSGAWTKLGVISNNATVKYTVKGLAEGTTYSFRVKSYKNADGKTDYSAYANINVRTLMKTPANIKGSATADSVTIQWDKNANATGYIVEQYKSGAWTKLGVISSNATVKYTVKGLVEGTTYSFRVKSYKNADSKTDYSTYANINVRTLMKTPANIKGSATADSVTIQWDKNANATGYIVEQYKSGAWTKLGVISSNATVKYTVKGLAEGTTYSFRVKSYKNADSKTDYSTYANINVRTLMKTPANIKGSATADSVTFQWDKNANATGYIVEQYKSGAWTKLGVISNNATVKYTVKGLAEGTTYSFRVKSYKNADGKTDYSTYANINVRTLMKTPANIKGSSTADSVTIQWDKNANATGYIVEQYKSGAWTKLGVISSNATVKYTVKGLAEGTTYSFRVKSYKNADSKTDYSTYANINVRTLMKTPANIKGSATADSVTFQWDKNANATGYIVEQYKSGSWTKLGVISSNATVKYTVKGLAEGTTYSFRAKSYKNDGTRTDYSTYANINVRTLMKIPANIKGSATADSVTIQWDKNANATGYIVEQYKSGSWTKLGVISNNATVKYTVKGLAEGTTYSFRVKSYKNADGKTDYSAYANINVRTLMKTPANIKGSATADSVTIQWDKNANATGYIVEQYKSGAWTKLGVISDNTVTKYTVKGLNSETTYTFRVKAYKNVGSVTVYSEYARAAVATRIVNVSKFTATAVSNTAIKLGWSKNDRATGYIIEQYKGGKWTQIAVTKNNTTLEFTVKGLASGTAYSFRIKSFRTVNGATSYSEYASAKATTAK